LKEQPIESKALNQCEKSSIFQTALKSLILKQSSLLKSKILKQSSRLKPQRGFYRRGASRPATPCRFKNSFSFLPAVKIEDSVSGLEEQAY